MSGATSGALPEYSRRREASMPETSTRFSVTRKDVNLILAELADHHPADALYAALLTALLDAAARLDTDASRLDTGREQTTDLRLLEEHAQLFREWLERAVMRGSSAGDHAKAQAFARLHGSER
jgi:hypothetical protein